MLLTNKGRNKAILYRNLSQLQCVGYDTRTFYSFSRLFDQSMRIPVLFAFTSSKLGAQCLQSLPRTLADTRSATDN